MPILSLPFVEFFPIEFPAAGMAFCQTREPSEFLGVANQIAFSGELFKILTHELVDARAERFGPPSGALDDLVIDGEGQVHKLIIRAHVIRVHRLDWHSWHRACYSFFNRHRPVLIGGFNVDVEQTWVFVDIRGAVTRALVNNLLQ